MIRSTSSAEAQARPAAAAARPTAAVEPAAADQQVVATLSQQRIAAAATIDLVARRAPLDHIRARARVGNLYVNRNQIGAVVGAQPFGGEGLSGTGPKAGGPHYLHRFAVERVASTDTTASGGNTSLMAMGPSTQPV